MQKKNEIVEINGKKVVLINEIKYKSRKISWDDIEKALKEYVGKTYEIEETHEIIMIGSDFPDEFCHSKYSYNLKNQIKRAKMNTITGLDKLIWIATNRNKFEDYNNKHGKRAKLGWSHFDVYFGLPTFDDYGSFLRYNYFCGKLIVRHTNQNKSYLYDIVRIKKREI